MQNIPASKTEIVKIAMPRNITAFLRAIGKEPEEYFRSAILGALKLDLDNGPSNFFDKLLQKYELAELLKE